MRLKSLTDEQLLEVINTHMELLESDTVLEMIEEVTNAITNNDTEDVLKDASPLEKIVLFTLEVYKRGFVSGQVLYNEAVAGLIQEKGGAV